MVIAAAPWPSLAHVIAALVTGMLVPSVLLANVKWFEPKCPGCTYWLLRLFAVLNLVVMEEDDEGYEYGQHDVGWIAHEDEGEEEEHVDPGNDSESESGVHWRTNVDGHVYGTNHEYPGV